jgi:spore germination protein YaaH
MPTARRLPHAVAAAAFSLAVLASSCADNPAHAATTSAPRHPTPQVTGYALGGTSAATVASNAPGLATLTVDGVLLQSTGGGLGSPDAGVVRLAHVAHRHHLRAELLVSNYSDAIGDFDPRAADRLLRSMRSIRAVAAGAVGLIRSGGWDGINVDLEALPARDARGLVLFLRELRRRLPQAKRLSVDVSANTTLAGYRQGGYRLRAIGQTVDVVQLMAYDQHGPTWSGPGPIGALPWQRKALAAALKVVPRSRLDLGVAGYGYSWTVAGGGTSVSDRQARRRVKASGAHAVWHARVGEWRAELPGGTVLWWSDGRSYRLRQRLAVEERLHGLAVWRIGSADTLPKSRHETARMGRIVPTRAVFCP